MTTDSVRSPDEVLVRIAHGVATLTLNAPSRRNALTLAMAAELEHSLDAAEADPSVGAIVVTGMPPVFCAGADRDVLACADEDRLRRVYRAFLRVQEAGVPTIAAVGGPAVGAGMNLALACDVRIAARSATFDTRFLRLGVHCGGGHTWLLERAVGPSAAAAMLLFGEVVDGARAESIGLAWRCVDDGLLLETAQQVAEVAAVNGRLARLSKETLIHAAGASHRQMVEIELGRQLESMTGWTPFGTGVAR